MESRGLLITFEGGEGAGKTTVINAITRSLSEKYQVLQTREPGGTELGENIRKLLLNTQGPISAYAELCLFLASRAQHIKEVILPALVEGKIVVCDRFNDSSVAYQGMARGLGMKEVESFCSFVSENLKPNLTLYLDIDPQEGLKRASNVGEHDRIESETIEFHQKIREGFLAIQREDPKRFVLIDAGASLETVFQESMKCIQLLLSRTPNFSSQ